jgi:Trk-type K+ transport system membrane component
MNLLEITVKNTIKTLIYMIVLSLGLTGGYIYVVEKSRNMYKDTIKQLVDENVDKVVEKLDKKTERMIILLSKILPLEKLLEKYKKQDDFVEERRRNLERMIKMWLITLCVIVIVTSLLHKKEMGSIFNILIHVCLVYGTVGLVIYGYLRQDLFSWTKVIIDENIANVIMEVRSK